ncbi:MAG: ATP-binding protein [Candidatus Tectomicrobia bacterium]|nr:ATP-binding protein [Candidatus Tectomicrobia bacterium]
MRNIVGQTPRGSDFFPRDNLVRHIYTRLNAGAHVYLAAPRRIGKTAIMRYLEDNPQENYEFKYLITASVDNADTYVQVLLESLHKLKKLPRRSLEAIGSFLSRINQVGAAGFEVGLSQGQATDHFAELESLIRTLDTGGTTVVIMIDEFPQTVENILREHGADAAEQFLQFNREIRHEAPDRIRFIFTGSIGLLTMAERLDATVHINDLNVVEIPPLSRAEATTLTKMLLDDNDVSYDDAAVEHLLDKISWFITFHIQLAVQELIDDYVDTNESVNVAAVDRAFAKIGERRNDIYFAHYSSRLKIIFDDREYDFALDLLDKLAREDECAPQHIRDLSHTHNLENYAIVLRTLAFDGYIFEYETDGDTYYRFTSPVLRLWWGNYMR